MSAERASYSDRIRQTPGLHADEPALQWGGDWWTWKQLGAGMDALRAAVELETEGQELRAVLRSGPGGALDDRLLGGDAAIIIPTSAVNTASAITRGFINVMKSGIRATKLGPEANRRRDRATAVVFMVDSSMEI